jgi:DNA gyrase subunit A
MATNIPPHNLGEVIDGTLALLSNPDISISELMHHIQAPDFPTAAILYGVQGLREAYTTGRGSVKIRARFKTEQKSRGLESLVVTEIPFALNKSKLLKKIADLVNDKRIEGISDLRDESDRNGIRIVIDLKKGVLSDVVINNLYKHTALESSFGINFLAVSNNRPKILNLKEYLELFIEFRKEVVLRRSRFDLDKAQKRAHILEGLRIALDNIDEVVAIIRGSSTPSEAKGKLIERFELTDEQSQAILDMRLQRLTNLEQSKIQEEYLEILKKIEYLQSIIANEEVLRNEVQSELKEIKDKFATPRRTQILGHDPDEIEVEDMIADEEVIISLSRKGYIKRTLLSSYHQQKRGGKGLSGANLDDSDLVQALLTTSNHQNLLMFTNYGRMLMLRVFEIPEGSRKARGIHIANLLDLQPQEYIATVLGQRDLNTNTFFVFITKNGMVKKSEVSLYKNLRKGGLHAVQLKEDDELIAVKEVIGSSKIMLITKNGYAIRFSSQDIRAVGRNAAGVKGVTLRDDDQVVSGVDLQEHSQHHLLTLTEFGFGKRTPVSEYRLQSRGGKGIINLKPTPKTGRIIGGLMVDEEDQIILLTSANKMIRFGVRDIRICGRNAQGVKLVNMVNGSVIVCFDRILHENSL